VDKWTVNSELQCLGFLLRDQAQSISYLPAPFLESGGTTPYPVSKILRISEIRATHRAKILLPNDLLAESSQQRT
jgi:hypothetical protein